MQLAFHHRHKNNHLMPQPGSSISLEDHKWLRSLKKGRQRIIPV